MREPLCLGTQGQPLQPIVGSDPHTNEWAISQSKPPGKFPGSTDPDSRVGYHYCTSFGGAKTIAGVRTNIHFVMPLRNIQRLRQFTGSRAKAMNVLDSS